MSIERIVITNIKAIEFAEFRAGALTVLTGANGTGKTSIIDAVVAVFEGGHNPDLIRKGAEFGKVDLCLSDRQTITVTVKPTKTERVVKDENGKVVPAPATQIAAMASSFAFDPLGFLTAPAKERAAWLAAVMPISVKAEDVVSFLPNPKTKATVLLMLPKKPMDIDGLARARGAIYDERRGENAITKRLGSTVDSLLSAVGADDAEDWAAKAEDVNGRLAVTQARREAIAEDKARKLVNFKRAAALEAAATKAGIAAEAMRKMEQIKAEQDVSLSAIDFGVEVAVNDYRETVEAACREEAAALDVQIESMVAEHATSKEKAAQQQKNASTRALLNKTRKEYDESLAKATLLDHAVAALDKAKDKALSETPIAGLEMADGEVIFEGIKFDQLNTAKKYDLAIRIGAERLGKLPLMVTDYGEHLDPSAWEEFKQSVLKSGIQFIVARVSDGPLEIDSVMADGTPVEA